MKLLPSVPKRLHYSTLFLDNSFWVPQCKYYITEIALELFLGVVILTGDLSDFRAVISGEFGLWENSILALQRNFYTSEIENESIP